MPYRFMQYIVYRQSPGDHQKEAAKCGTRNGVIFRWTILHHFRQFRHKYGWKVHLICFFSIFRFRWKFRETSANCELSRSAVSFRDIRSSFVSNLSTFVGSSSVFSCFESFNFFFFCRRLFLSCTVSSSYITRKCN